MEENVGNWVFLGKAKKEINYFNGASHHDGQSGVGMDLEWSISQRLQGFGQQVDADLGVAIERRQGREGCRKPFVRTVRLDKVSEGLLPTRCSQIFHLG